MITVNDLELLGLGSNTILVKVFFPSDHNIEYVQTFMSNSFEHMKSQHKGLGFSQKVTRKVFFGEYVFISLVDTKSMKGLVINKGFHIGDCQARPVSAYKISVPLEIKTEAFRILTTEETSLGAFASTTVKIKLDRKIPQNKENMHQLYSITKVERSFDSLGLSAIDKSFTTMGSKTASIRVWNFGNSIRTLPANVHIGWAKSLINEEGVEWILKSLTSE